jgi:hypothetical protein
VARDRPLGDCLFYIKDCSIQGTPIIIATHVNEHYIYASNTLILYPDNVLYHGSIRNNISSLPRAEGQGMLLSPDFIYQGEFKNGYPHGYGSYRSRTMEYVGVFKNGEPFGEGIEKTPSRLFIGCIGENGQRKGCLIDKHNHKILVDSSEELQESKLSLRSHLRE